MDIPDSLDTWQSNMRMDDKSNQILTNIENEDNVPSTVVRDVFNKLEEILDASKHPVSQFVQTLNETPASALAGPDGILKSMSLLTRFTLLSNFAQYQPEAKRKGYNKSKFLSKPSRLNELRKVKLGYPPRQIVWTAPEEPISNDLSHGQTIDETLNRLGMYEKIPAHMVRITYNESDASPPYKVPTVFDAADFEKFRPSKKGSPCGMTHPVSSVRTGYPEYVHHGCIVDDPGLELVNP